MLLRIGLTNFPVDLLNQFAVSSISIRIPGLLSPIIVRLNSTDPDILRTVFVRGKYEHSLPADPKVIVDVGAKAGHSTAWFRARFPRAFIIAIEPDPDDFRILQQNCSGFSHVHLINAALGGTLTFNEPSRNQNVQRHHLDAAADGDQIRKLTMYEIIERFNFEYIDILRLNPNALEKAGFGDLSASGRVECIAIDRPNRGNSNCFDATSNVLPNWFRHSKIDDTDFFYKKLSAIETSADARQVWLVSDGRSGSTWLSSILNHRKNFAEYFEPLHSMFSPELFGEPLITYERPGQLSDKIRDFYAHVFSRKWSLPRSGPNNPENRSVLVKDIHALLLAKAVSAEFPKIEVVCLVRDPVAVAASKLTMESRGSVWFREPALLLRNELLRSDWLSPFEKIIWEASTQFEKYVMLWAIMYHIISRQFEQSKITYVRYSDSQERIIEIANKFSYVENDSEVGNSELISAFKTRSRTDAPLDAAKYVPSKRELEYSQEIVRVFGLEDLLYGSLRLRE
jgi:FkbM family methyltransferase